MSNNNEQLEKTVFPEWLYFIPQQLNNLVDVLEFDQGKVLYYHIESGEQEICLCIEEKMELNVREDIKTNVKKMNGDQTKKQIVILKVRGIDLPDHEVQTVVVKEYAVEIIDATEEDEGVAQTSKSKTNVDVNDLKKNEENAAEKSESKEDPLVDEEDVLKEGVKPFKKVSRPQITLEDNQQREYYMLKVVLPSFHVMVYDEQRESIKDGFEELTIKQIREAFFKYGGSIIIGYNDFDFDPETKCVYVESVENDEMVLHIEPENFRSIEDFLDFKL